MWFPTKQKVLRALDDLIGRLDRLDKRIAEHEEQVALGTRLGLGSGDPQVAATRDAHTEIRESLKAARSGIAGDRVDFRVISKQLQSVNGAVSHVERILDLADADVARAKGAFRRRFGNAGD